MMPEAIKDDLINKLMVGAVIGLLTWNIYTTQQLTIDIAVLQEKIEQLEEKLK
jgi:F0F1-type ATP synthase assembly protein I